jgi:hypothetical protein
MNSRLFFSELALRHGRFFSFAARTIGSLRGGELVRKFPQISGLHPATGRRSRSATPRSTLPNCNMMARA